MNEIGFAAPEMAASRQRGRPADERKLRHDGFASGLGLLLARKLAEYSERGDRHPKGPRYRSRYRRDCGYRR
jgi:hypothetical protein